jgi:hypothetical protein
VTYPPNLLERQVEIRERGARREPGEDEDAPPEGAQANR